ncbi:hypothetical protein H2248_007827 [Termitomyces sp. 'cryptogamus']|nr:hypothetical protein H2248_007827 [Termitomyces sp. 'cryptogamus']
MEFQPLILRMYSAPIWFLGWLATSVRPTKQFPSVPMIWRATMRRAHILKFVLLVISPNALWIQSSVATSPSRSLEMTFGQLFTLFISAFSTVSLISAVWEIRGETWRAVLLSRVLPESIETEIPFRPINIRASPDRSSISLARLTPLPSSPDQEPSTSSALASATPLLSHN